MKETKEEFLDIVDDIISLIRENAIKRLKLDSFEEIQNHREKFISEVHKDFHRAQLKICEGLINKEEELKGLQNELKNARRNNESKAVTERKSEIIVNNFRQLVYRKLADCIAWQLINGQHYIARRLFIHQPPPIITSSNINDVMNRVNELNSNDAQSFALISDLTSFIQIGDILQKTQKGIYIIEAKEGEKNEIASEILAYLNLPDDIDYDEVFPDSFDKKMKEQVKRMHRQDVRAERAKEVINKGIGKDPYSGKDMFITEVDTDLEYYYDVIEKSHLYESISERISKSFEYIRTTDLKNFPAGRYPIDGENIFALVSEYQTKTEWEGKLEAHRKYIDVQFVIEGEELMGYSPLSSQKIIEPYNEENDIIFFTGEKSFTKVSSGMFAIFFPEDVHMPGIMIGNPSPVKKLVIKVRIN